MEPVAYRREVWNQPDVRPMDSVWKTKVCPGGDVMSEDRAAYEWQTDNADVPKLAKWAVDDRAGIEKLGALFDRLEARTDTLEGAVAANIAKAAHAMHSDAPERYVRILVTKNTKGYQGETTVSLRGANWSIDELRGLLVESDTLLREEIVRREELDTAMESEAAA